MTSNMLKRFINNVLECDCGKKHSVKINDIFYSEDAIEICADNVKKRRLAPRIICIVDDRRTNKVAGEKVEDIFSYYGLPTYHITIPDPDGGVPVCDETTYKYLCQKISADTSLILAVGSGVINDLCKWVSNTLDIPYISIPTAASMNGYSSENIAPTINGIKVVIKGVTPQYIAAIPSVIQKAPYVLTTAGLGDVIAKPVSTLDWKINHKIFGDYFCTLCASIIDEIEPLYMNNPSKLKKLAPSAIEALFNALILTGISMTLAGTSYPASGGEHLISHAIDMKSLIEGRNHDYHGRQVGIGTIFASALYERILKLETPKIRVLEDEVDREYWKYLSPYIEKEISLKNKKIATSVIKLPKIWDDIRSIISAKFIEPRKIKEILRSAGGACTIYDIDCSKDFFALAVIHSHQLRERYTVLDLARVVGILPESVYDIIDEYLID